MNVNHYLGSVHVVLLGALLMACSRHAVQASESKDDLFWQFLGATGNTREIATRIRHEKTTEEVIAFVERTLSSGADDLDLTEFQTFNALALLMIGDDVEWATINDIVLPYLNHAVPSYRQMAVRVLAIRGGEAAIPITVVKLNDEDYVVRWLALKSLVKSDNEVVHQALRLWRDAQIARDESREEPWITEKVSRLLDSCEGGSGDN